METVQLVHHCHVEGRGGRALFDEAVNMEIRMIGPLINQPVDEIGIAVIGEDHRAVASEYPIEF